MRVWGVLLLLRHSSRRGAPACSSSRFSFRSLGLRHSHSVTQSVTRLLRLAHTCFSIGRSKAANGRLAAKSFQQSSIFRFRMDLLPLGVLVWAYLDLNP